MTENMDFMLLSMLLKCKKIGNKEELKKKFNESKAKIEIAQTKRPEKRDRREILENGHMISSSRNFLSSKRAYVNDYLPRISSTPKRIRTSRTTDRSNSYSLPEPILEISEIRPPTFDSRISPVQEANNDFKPPVFEAPKEITTEAAETQTCSSLNHSSTQTDELNDIVFERTISENSTSDASTSTWFQMIELTQPVPPEMEEIEARDASTQTEINEENTRKSFFGLF
ncbi:Oidioi.mRNA.OKI2018_I69.chr1.g143.t1.cds [Oikopleura dioica]|uniref:Oidioi.mRNA.OKI2018_I69.chr1.g143.t1.cds n=1 Tax=Oikopleura dioica TaxID=34765 RepID=A0ABN7SIY2_OIKDI|nr:Oidioi.mRNA.OKI2018_I69.chr1.g143.t1.cds [Oikopleura dioica]